jgi:hypothetical protein
MAIWLCSRQLCNDALLGGSLALGHKARLAEGQGGHTGHVAPCSPQLGPIQAINGLYAA